MLWRLLWERGADAFKVTGVVVSVHCIKNEFNVILLASVSDCDYVERFDGLVEVEWERLEFRNMSFVGPVHAVEKSVSVENVPVLWMVVAVGTFVLVLVWARPPTPVPAHPRVIFLELPLQREIVDRNFLTELTKRSRKHSAGHDRKTSVFLT